MLAPKMEINHDLPRFVDVTGRAIRAGAMRGAQRTRVRGKLMLRDDIRRAGLGDRLANTWRDEVYPKAGRQSWHPTVFLWSKAPEIITAHTDGVTIRHREGLHLAIPTENTPMKGRKPASPVEVEAMFDTDFIFIHGRGRQLLAFIDKTKRGRLKRARRKGRSVAGVQTRFDKMVLMFVMVPQVTLRKKLYWPALAQDIGQLHRRHTSEEISRALAET